MSVVQHLIESQVKSFVAKARVQLENWLDNADVDENGVKDKAQILSDFDHVTNGLMEAIPAIVDLGGLVGAYIRTYGRKKQVASATPAESTGNQSAQA